MSTEDPPKRPIASWLSHPLFLLLVTSALSSIIVPRIVEQFKEGELRLTNRSARAVKLLSDVQSVEKAALDIRLLFDKAERLSREQLAQPERTKSEIESIKLAASTYPPDTPQRKKIEKLAEDAEKMHLDRFIAEKLSNDRPWNQIYADLEVKIAAYRLAGDWAQSVALETVLVKDFSKEEHEKIAQAASTYSKSVHREYLLHHQFFRELQIALTYDGVSKVVDDYDIKLREFRRIRNESAVDLLATVSATKARPSDLLLYRY